MPGLPVPDTACSVVTTTERRPAARRIGSSAITKPIVVQFGQATMPRSFSSASGLISGTTSGTFGSSRQVDDLSIATPPRFATSGASSFESAPVAAKKAKSTPSNASGRASRTSISRPAKRTLWPAERPLASARSSPTGKRRSASSWSTTSPTAPVAPTTATVRSRSMGWAGMERLLAERLVSAGRSKRNRIPGGRRGVKRTPRCARLERGQARALVARRPVAAHEARSLVHRPARRGDALAPVGEPQLGLGERPHRRRRRAAAQPARLELVALLREERQQPLGVARDRAVQPLVPPPERRGVVAVGGGRPEAEGLFQRDGLEQRRAGRGGRSGPVTYTVRCQLADPGGCGLRAREPPAGVHARRVQAAVVPAVARRVARAGAVAAQRRGELGRRDRARERGERAGPARGGAGRARAHRVPVLAREGLERERVRDRVRPGHALACPAPAGRLQHEGAARVRDQVRVVIREAALLVAAAAALADRREQAGDDANRSLRARRALQRE